MQDDSSETQTEKGIWSRLGRDFLGKLILVVLGAALASGYEFLVNNPLKNAFPTASLVPEKITVAAGDVVQFDASGSVDPDGDVLEYSWLVAGLPFSNSSVARCEELPNRRFANCRFVLPGTFSVSVSVTDSVNSAVFSSAVVDVKISGGYITITLPGVPANSARDAYRELLHGIDWAHLQPLFSRPIVLFDPDENANVYAVSIRPADAHGKQDLTGVLQGRKILVPSVSNEAREALETAFSRLGAVLITLPFPEIAQAVQSGLGEGQFVPLANPNEIVVELDF